jgi:large subunit ribosomal protein L25
MEYYKLSSEKRTGSGKGVARQLRFTGQVPAILYGHKREPVQLSLSEIDLRKIFQVSTDSPIVNLAVKGDKEASGNAIVREVQRHPTTGKVIHIDLQRIDLDEKVRVQVPVVLNGDAKGVKEMGGILEHGLRELNITCLPSNIPESVEIEVTDLGIGDSIHVRDIVDLYPQFEINDDDATTMANVVPPKVEVEPVAEEVEEGAEEPELVSKDKEDSEAEAKDKEAAKEE